MAFPNAPIRTIRGTIDLTILGGLFSGSTSASLTASVYNLGPTLSEGDRADDQIEVKGSTTVTASVFWIFKTRFHVDLTFVRRQNIWDADPAKLSGQSSFLQGCREVYKDRKECWSQSCRISGWKAMDESQSLSSSTNSDYFGIGDVYYYSKSDGPTVFRSYTRSGYDHMPIEYSGRRRRRRRQHTRRRIGNRAMVIGDSNEKELQLIFYWC